MFQKWQFWVAVVGAVALYSLGMQKEWFNAKPAATTTTTTPAV